MVKIQNLLEEIRNIRKEFQELKLLQLKLVESMLPKVESTKRERSLIKNMSRMKFYTLEEVKKKLKV